MVPPTGRRAGYQEGIRADIIRLSCALPEVLLAHEHLPDNVLAQWGEVLIKAHRSRRFWLFEWLTSDVTSVLDIGGGLASLSWTQSYVWSWVAIPHPERHALQLAPRTQVVQSPTAWWVARSSEPCWVRLLSQNKDTAAAVVLPLVIPQTEFRSLSIDTIRVSLGGSAHDRTAWAVLDARQTGSAPVDRQGPRRRTFPWVVMPGCGCRRLRSFAGQPIVPHARPRHLWAGFL